MVSQRLTIRHLFFLFAVFETIGANPVNHISASDKSWVSIQEE